MSSRALRLTTLSLALVLALPSPSHAIWQLFYAGELSTRLGALVTMAACFISPASVIPPRTVLGAAAAKGAGRGKGAAGDVDEAGLAVAGLGAASGGPEAGRRTQPARAKKQS